MFHAPLRNYYQNEVPFYWWNRIGEQTNGYINMSYFNQKMLIIVRVVILYRKLKGKKTKNCKKANGKLKLVDICTVVRLIELFNCVLIDLMLDLSRLIDIEMSADIGQESIFFFFFFFFFFSFQPVLHD